MSKTGKNTRISLRFTVFLCLDIKKNKNDLAHTFVMDFSYASLNPYYEYERNIRQNVIWLHECGHSENLI
jgi:hypothetical protein